MTTKKQLKIHEKIKLIKYAGVNTMKSQDELVTGNGMI